MSDDALNRFDRIVAMFIHLQSSRVVKAQELADRFDVSLRTVYRDIRSLEAAAGIAERVRRPPRHRPAASTAESGSAARRDRLRQCHESLHLYTGESGPRAGRHPCRCTRVANPGVTPGWNL